MAATRVVMHQIVLPAEVDSLGICFGGQVRRLHKCIDSRHLTQLLSQTLGMGTELGSGTCQAACMI